MPSIRYKTFSVAQFARLFLQLAQMESAGISAFEAFGLLAKADQANKIRFLHLQARLRKGHSIAEAGFAVGLFNENLKTLIHAAESSGRLAEIYRKLAAYYGNLSIRIKKIKARLLLPTLTLIIALLIQPLPALVNADINIGQYLQQSLGRLLMLVLGAVFLSRLPAILSRLGLLAHYHNLQLSLPVVDHWLINRQLNEFFFILAMMLDAGLAFSEALPKAVAGIHNSMLRTRFNTALALMKTGASVTSTLALVKEIKPVTLQIINSGEQSGKLAENLLHFNKIDAETIALQDESLAEWLPRLVYAMIAAWIGYGLLAGKTLPCLQDALAC